MISTKSCSSRVVANSFFFDNPGNRLYVDLAGANPGSRAIEAGARSYGFNVDGQIFPPGAPALILRGVAMTIFDGEGGLSQVDHATANGIPR